MTIKTHIQRVPVKTRHASSLLVALMVLLSVFRVAGQSAMPDEVCVGATKHYWVDPRSGSTYTWKINGVVQPSATNEIYITWDLPYTPAGSPYTVSVQEQSINGCYGDERTGQLYLFETLPVNVSVVPTQNPACSGVRVTFTAMVDNGGTAPVYKWFVNGSSVGTSVNTYSYLPLPGDVVSCEVTSNALCVTGNPAISAPVTMQVVASPTVIFVPCFDVITSVEAKPFKLRGGLPLGGSYSGAGVNTATCIFSPALAPTGIVPVTYSYTNSAGCSSFAVVNIQNNPAPANFICGTNQWIDIRDGKTYPTAQIGTQCWLAANLNHGQQILSPQLQADNCVNEKYCYENDPANCTGVGALYQWDELMKYDNTPASQGVCPPGWHVPVEAEWTALLDFYGGSANAGKPLQNDTLSEFHAIPAGVLYGKDTWSFKGLATLFWSSTPTSPIRVISHGMNTVDPSVSCYESLKVNAFPVRCVKNY